MIVQNKVLKQRVHDLDRSLYMARIQAGGQVQVMHRTIRKLLGLMNEEQRQQFANIRQAMHDELKMAEKLK
jgi:hypothetical protein